MKKLKMSNRSKIALDKTLRKWRALANGDKTALLIYCPLCEVYNHGVEKPCIYCPVKLKTGKEGCEGSPFWKFNSDSCDYKKQADDEVKFLESCYY